HRRDPHHYPRSPDGVPAHRSRSHRRETRRLPTPSAVRTWVRFGGRVPRDPTDGFRDLHGCMFRPEPQGHAPPARKILSELPPAPSTHLVKYPRRAGDVLGDGRVELPDRTSPIPADAQREPSPRPADSPRLLRRTRHPLYRDRTARCIRNRHSLPQSRRARTLRPVRMPTRNRVPAHPLRFGLVDAAKGSAPITGDTGQG